MQLFDVNRPSVERQHPRPVGIGETQKIQSSVEYAKIDWTWSF